MRFKEGQIVFFKNDSIYSKIISFYNFSVYGERGFTHVGIITKVLKDNIQIHEALSKGFTKSYYSKLEMEALIDLGDLEIKSAGKLNKVFENAEKYLGRPYAWFDIFGIILSFLFKFRGLRFTGANKLICSEAVARILYDSSNKTIDFVKEYDKHYGLITPMDIYKSKFLK